MTLLLKIFVAGTDNFGLIPGMCMVERELINEIIKQPTALIN